MGEIRIGCSGWSYTHWRETIYPKGLPASRWLEHYTTLFDTVELNTTFYRLARPAAVQQWVDVTPPDFVFAAKASRFLIHMKRFTDMGRGVERFYESIEPLVGSGKLGPVVWQLPESFRRDDERLTYALERLPPGDHCFEFRHPSWFAAEVLALLERHGVALVIGDHPSRGFQLWDLTAPWTLVRMHHGTRGRNGNYSETELDELAERVAALALQADVFVYFNNDWEGYAVRNALGLRRRLGV